MQQLEPKGKQQWEKDLERFWAILCIMLSNRSLLSNRNKVQIMGGILNYLVMTLKIKISSVQFSCSVTSDWSNPMDCSTPGPHVHHQLLELTQTHVHWVSDTIQPSHPLLSPSPPTFNPSQRKGLFKQVSSSHQVAKVLEFQLQHRSFQWIFRTDFL